ncbi:MAG: hypothetical protein WCT10_02070 [Patescibacteria group bacterium]|jgi:hypothetical protein
MNRKLIIIIVSVFVVVLLGGGALAFYLRSRSVLEDAAQVPVGQSGSGVEAGEQQPRQDTPSVPVPLSGDDDGDGLTVAEEAKLGTDPNNWDTDGDTLGDGAEYYNFKTNPLKSDTDGDGLSDSEEYRSGRDPLVKGK